MHSSTLPWVVDLNQGGTLHSSQAQTKVFARGNAGKEEASSEMGGRCGRSINLRVTEWLVMGTDS